MNTLAALFVVAITAKTAVSCGERVNPRGTGSDMYGDKSPGFFLKEETLYMKTSLYFAPQ